MSPQRPGPRPGHPRSKPTGFLDGALIVGLAPRPTHFLVYDKSFERWVGGILRASGQIPLGMDAEKSRYSNKISGINIKQQYP